MLRTFMVPSSNCGSTKYRACSDKPTLPTKRIARSRRDSAPTPLADLCVVLALYNVGPTLNAKDRGESVNSTPANALAK